MTIGPTPEQQVDSIIIELELLRLCRLEFNTEIDTTESLLLQRISDIRGLGIETVEYVPRGRTNTSPSDSREKTNTLNQLIEEVGERTFQTIRRPLFEPITSPHGVRVGDRVRITNRLYHVTGEPTEQDRLATVTKVNRIKVQLTTDTGHTTSRIRANLTLAIQYE